MEKTRCKLNICGVDITVSGDVDTEAIERIAQAVRVRMQNALQSSGTATVEKAAVITAMNFCEELARRDERHRALEKHIGELEAELREARAMKRRLTQTEAKLHIAEEKLTRAENSLAERNANANAPLQLRVIGQPQNSGTDRRDEPGEALRNPLRPEHDGGEGFRSFYLKKRENP